MPYRNELVAQKLRRWEAYLSKFHLPEWESIPNFGLYMEQLTELLKQYLDYLPPEMKESEIITAAAINNYVRTKVMPSPRKRRYYREHIAYLIIILTLKQSLPIAMIHRIIPTELSSAQIEATYRAYVQQHRIVANYFIEQVRLSAAPILQQEESGKITANRPEELIIQAAISGGLSCLLSEKLLLLEDESGSGESHCRSECQKI